MSRNDDGRDCLDGDDLPPDLAGVAQRYAAQPVPRPQPEQTRQLVERLLAEQARATQIIPPRQWSPLASVRVARWRVRLLGPQYWIACVLLLSVAAVFSVVNSRPGAAVPLVLLLPLTGVLGLAQATRTPSRGLREVVIACPLSLLEVSAGSALAVVALDCAFGLVATAFLALISWAPFASLLVAWLGPLLLLTALSLPVALRWSVLAAIGVGAGPWLALAFVALVSPNGPAAQVFALPHDTRSIGFHLLAAVLGAVALLLALSGSAWPRALLRAR